MNHRDRDGVGLDGEGFEQLSNEFRTPLAVRAIGQLDPGLEFSNRDGGNDNIIVLADR